VSAWFYRFAYAVGFKPWEEVPAEQASQISALFAREEAGRQQPYGSALELGCGSGRWSVELAQRGWEVVGIDLVPKAVRAARQRAQEAGVDARFVAGDVTDLQGAGVASGVRFVLDVECFNHLNDVQRAAVGREVDAVADPGASVLLLVWKTARRGPLPPGASRDDLLRAFPGWRIDAEDPYTAELPRPLRNIDPRWYRLTRS